MLKEKMIKTENNAPPAGSISEQFSYFPNLDVYPNVGQHN